MLTVAARIRDALDAGSLKPKPKEKYKPVTKMGDLLEPWEEFFPGADPGATDSRRNIVLYRPQFTPTPRRSPLPLPAPRKIEPSAFMVSSRLFASIQGIWDWYGLKGKADKGLLKLPFNDDGFSDFSNHLFKTCENYYPLVTYLENMESIAECEGIYLNLPCKEGNEEDAGIMEAFLTGADSVASIMTYLDEDDALELHKKDRALVKEIGYPRLFEFYAVYEGEKACDLNRLVDWYPTFFSEIEEKYPEFNPAEIPVISYDNWLEMVITCAKDIEFSIEWAKAYENMIDEMPCTWHMSENECGASEEFVHDVCNVWRQGHGKRKLKWE